MIPEWELWACAHTLIRQHGADAPIYAAMRADALLEEGEQEGAATWRLIVDRVNQLLAGQERTSLH